MREKLQEIKDTLKKAREYLIPDEKGDINYSKSDELILELFDYEVIDWMIMKIEDQQATIDSLSMAHDAIHREIPKDKHTLIKNLIALNKRVQDLEQWAFETKPYIKSLEQQNKLYRKAIELINNAWTVQATYEGLANYIAEIIEALEGEG